MNGVATLLFEYRLIQCFEELSLLATFSISPEERSGSVHLVALRLLNFLVGFFSLLNRRVCVLDVVFLVFVFRFALSFASNDIGPSDGFAALRTAAGGRNQVRWFLF